MNIFRDLAGGILIIIAAGVIGIAQNAARPDGIPFVPKAADDVSGKPYTSESTPAGDPASAATQRSGPVAAESRGGQSAATLAADEIAAGVVSKERLKELLSAGGIVLIDARLSGEYEAGHIDGAMNIPYEKLSEYYEKLAAAVPLDAMIVCYCQSVTCEDSENLARELKFMGYKNVVRYEGGWDEWSQTGQPQSESTQQN